MDLTRRTLIAGGAAFAAAVSVSPAFAAGAVRVFKSASCGCCGAWAAHLEAAGFAVETRDVHDLAALKERLGVPADLASCHTAIVEGYVVEGHVPADDVRRLLARRPEAIGIAVPGMPVGSPGMEIPGVPADAYEVVLFAEGRREVFSRH